MKKEKDYSIKKPLDTGVRATFGGKLYVDKKAFFKRPEVRKVLNDVMKSEELKAHLSVK